MTAPSLDDVVALEVAVWEALARGDAEADLAALADDFLGVYPSGFADRFDHADQLAHGPSVASYEIVTPTLRVLEDTTVLLAYEARYRRKADDEIERMYVTSAWSLRNGAWINVFSQDTPVDADSR